MREGDVAGALADFSRVLELEPGFVDALVNRASLLLELGGRPRLLAMSRPASPSTPSSRTCSASPPR